MHHAVKIQHDYCSCKLLIKFEEFRVLRKKQWRFKIHQFLRKGNFSTVFWCEWVQNSNSALWVSVDSWRTAAVASRPLVHGQGQEKIVFLHWEYVYKLRCSWCRHAAWQWAGRLLCLAVQYSPHSLEVRIYIHWHNSRLDRGKFSVSLFSCSPVQDSSVEIVQESVGHATCTPGGPVRPPG